MSTLVADGVCRRIDDQWLLAPTDARVESGECLVLRGENGAGKSTLLRWVASARAGRSTAPRPGSPLARR